MRTPRAAAIAALGLAMSLAVAACGAQGGRTVHLALETLNASGVEGHVSLTEAGSGLTRVEIDVEPAGHASMPAHIHPGSCAELVPQPKYALENVVDGRSTTEVRASLDELLAGDHALNLHRSNTEMDVYTACIDLS